MNDGAKAGPASDPGRGVTDAAVEAYFEATDEYWEGCNDRPDDWQRRTIRVGLEAALAASTVPHEVTEALRFYADKANWTEPDQVNQHELFDTAMGADLGDKARAALSAYLAVPVEAWRPIESAPKDGTWFLAGFPKVNAGPDYPAYSVLRWKLESWRDEEGTGGFDNFVWMPLPLPPGACDGPRFQSGN